MMLFSASWKSAEDIPVMVLSDRASSVMPKRSNPPPISFPVVIHLNFERGPRRAETGLEWEKTISRQLLANSSPGSNSTRLDMVEDLSRLGGVTGVRLFPCLVLGLLAWCIAGK